MEDENHTHYVRVQGDPTSPVNDRCESRQCRYTLAHNFSICWLISIIYSFSDSQIRLLIKLSLKVSTHLKRVATLPCELSPMAVSAPSCTSTTSFHLSLLLLRCFCPSVCLSVTVVYCVKTAERVELRFGTKTTLRVWLVFIALQQSTTRYNRC